jgi:hypothetical protein
MDRECGCEGLVVVVGKWKEGGASNKRSGWGQTMRDEHAFDELHGVARSRVSRERAHTRIKYNSTFTLLPENSMDKVKTFSLPVVPLPIPNCSQAPTYISQ